MHVHNLPRHAPILLKPDADELAANLVAWFGECLQFLCPENWGFSVDADGKYLPGVHVWVEPMPFMFEHHAWELTLRCMPLGERVPHRRQDLTYARERLHIAITVVLMNLTSSAKAGKLLATLREAYDLKKLRKSMIM